MRTKADGPPVFSVESELIGMLNKADTFLTYKEACIKAYQYRRKTGLDNIGVVDMRTGRFVSEVAPNRVNWAIQPIGGSNNG